MFSMPGRSFRGPLPALTDEQRQLEQSLRDDVETLAGTIGERNVWRPEALAEAARHVEGRLERMGYPVRRQPFTAAGMECVNVEVECPGEDADEGVVILGAHYDSVQGSPGANDNASAVAALLALAERFADQRPRRTFRFVAFANEEPPFFQTGEMGSMAYAERCRARGERVAGMIALDGLGCYSEAEGSQTFPVPVGGVYPSVGNFIAFVGNQASNKLLRRCVGAFREGVAFPSEGAALPGFLPGVGWSDHWSFWQQGYPAIMVTDTLPFRDPHYHTPSDTPEKVDFDRLSRVVDGLRHVLAELTQTGV